MALFGEKYGDVVRMVQIGEGEYSRELCGGTHVRATAEIGLLRIQSETSSAANVRRIEALTGPAAVALVRDHDRWLAEIARTCAPGPRGRRRRCASASSNAGGWRRSSRSPRRRRAAGGVDAGGGSTGVDRRARGAGGRGRRGPVLSAAVEVPDPKALPELVDRLKGKLADAAIVLGGAHDGRVHLIVGVTPALVARGVKAGAVVKAAAAPVGGGGGGRDTLAQAGGRDPRSSTRRSPAAGAAIEARSASAR